MEVQEVKFNGKLLSVSENTLKLNNEKETEYRIGTIEFADKDGVVQQCSTMIFEGNYKHGMQVGISYQSTARLIDGNVYLQTSHLTGADRATSNMFDFSFVKEEQEVTEKAFENSDKII